MSRVAAPCAPSSGRRVTGTSFRSAIGPGHSRGGNRQRVGLDAGADDYLPKRTTFSRTSSSASIAGTRLAAGTAPTVARAALRASRLCAGVANVHGGEDVVLAQSPQAGTTFTVSTDRGVHPAPAPSSPRAAELSQANALRYSCSSPDATLAAMYMWFISTCSRSRSTARRWRPRRPIGAARPKSSWTSGCPAHPRSSHTG